MLDSQQWEQCTVSVSGRPFAAALAVAALLAACAGGPKPTVVAGNIEAAQQLNRTPSGRPSPLLVRVYELKSVTAFNKADFMSVYQRDQAELAADFVAKDEYLMGPGESKAFSKTLSPDTRFLGVLAAYRDLEHATWRTSVPIQAGQKQRIVIRAGELAVEAAAVR